LQTNWILDNIEIMKTHSELTLTVQIFREGKKYVSYNPELEVASCGNTVEEARYNLKDAMRGFLKSATKTGTLDLVLEEAGFIHKGKSWVTPELVTLDRMSLAL